MCNLIRGTCDQIPRNLELASTSMFNVYSFVGRTGSVSFYLVI